MKVQAQKSDEPGPKHRNILSVPEDQKHLGGTMNSPMLLDPEWPAKFIASLAKHGVVTLACKEASISRKTVYDLRANDTAFKGLWDDAIEQAVDVLEATARHRAMHGTKVPLIHRGKEILDKEGKPIQGTRVSDALMIFLLKKYRYPDQIQHTGPGGGPIQVNLSANPTKVMERLGRVMKHVDPTAPALGSGDRPSLAIVDEEMMDAIEMEERENDPDADA